MPRRYEDSLVYRRLSNGGCIMDRRCCECRREFIGERNICPACRNSARRKSGKFNAEYHRRYYHDFLSKAALLRRPGELSKKTEILGPRKEAFEKQKRRIQAEMKAIRKAGLDPNNDSILVIERAGVVLEDCRFALTDLQIQETADYAENILMTG